MKILLLTMLLFIISTKCFSQQPLQLSASTGVIVSSHGSLGYQTEAKGIFSYSDSLQFVISAGLCSWKDELGPSGNKFRDIPLLLGVRVPFISGLVSPYLEVQAGVHFIRRDYTLETYDITERGLFRLTSSERAIESAAKFAFNFRLGALYSLCNNLDLDLNLNYSRVLFNYIYIYPTQISTGKLSLYGISLGMNYKLYGSMNPSAYIPKDY